MGAKQPIIPMIRDLDRGRVIPAMQEGVNRIVEAIENNRGAGNGEITLKIKIKSKSEGAYTITPTVTVKVPEATRADTIFFLDEESGELQRHDPRQPDLPAVVDADFRNNLGGRDNDQ